MQPVPAAVDVDPRIQETRFAAIPDEAEDTSTVDHGSVLNDSDDSRNSNGHVSSNHDYHTVAHDSTNGISNGDLTVQNSSTKDQPKATLSPRVLAPDLLRGLLMVLQAIDHCSVSQGAWRHGVALESEADGTVVNTWNDPVAWTARMLTHLCAPGFMFLLGMGVVYFGRSRRKLGWSSWQMIRHFAIRAIVLVALNELFFTLPFGRGRVAIINIVLFALAINYLLAGLLWLAINATEELLSKLLEPVLRQSEVEERPLLRSPSNSGFSVSSRACRASWWHIHNVIIFALAIITIAWNHWLSPHHGHCPSTALSYTGPTTPKSTSLGPWFDFWFLPLTTKVVLSPFPPLAWLSPAILGLLYARAVLSRNYKPYTINASNALIGVSLMVLFILTRLLHFGNLSENCLRMPEHLSSPHRNQYLTSFRSFLYITKYPPSFSYLALTLAFNFFLLSFFGTLPGKIATRIPTLLTFGQSALFFYIVHLALYFALGEMAKAWFGHELGYMDPFNGRPAVGTQGKPWVMWVTWVLGLLMLWPMCRAYGRFKSGKSVDSVWRFF